MGLGTGLFGGVGHVLGGYLGLVGELLGGLIHGGGGLGGLLCGIGHEGTPFGKVGNAPAGGADLSPLCPFLRNVKWPMGPSAS